MVHGRGCNPHRSLWRHWWRHNSETIRDREKRRPPRPMKSSELSNGENRIALRQLLQNRKLWRHNLGSRRKLQKMAPENFSIGVFYNITKNQDNPIKTHPFVGCSRKLLLMWAELGWQWPSAMLSHYEFLIHTVGHKKEPTYFWLCSFVNN